MTTNSENDTNPNDVLDINTPETEDNEDDISISFGDEEDDKETQESSTIRDLRKQIRALQAKTSNQSIQKEEEIVLGEKPTLDSCDMDVDKFEKELEAYHDRSAKIKEKAIRQESEDKRAKDNQAKELEVFEKQKNELGARDFTKFQNEFLSSVTKEQGSLILRAASNKALMIYALGKNPNQLDKLLNITDPVRLAAEVGKLEVRINVDMKNGNKAAPKPETRVTSQATSTQSKSSDKTLERLEKEAAISGDRTKVVAYKKSLRG